LCPGDFGAPFNELDLGETQRLQFHACGATAAVFSMGAVSAQMHLNDHKIAGADVGEARIVKRAHANAFCLLIKPAVGGLWRR
jgi:hypothetical protein